MPSTQTLAIGKTATLTATVTDSAGQPVSGASVTFDVGGRPSGSVNTNAAGQAVYAYKGQTPGTDTVTASTSGGANVSSNAVTVYWTGPPAAVEYGGDLGNVVVGSRSAPLPVLIENQYPKPLKISSVRVSGPSDFAMTADQCAGVTLSQYQTCAVYVNVTPSITGPIGGELVLIDDSVSSPTSLPLTAIGRSAVSGPQGPQGPVGPAGKQGPAGPQGPAGKVTCKNNSHAVMICTLLFPRGTWTVDGTTAHVAFVTISRRGHILIRKRISIDGRNLSSAMAELGQGPLPHNDHDSTQQEAAQAREDHHSRRVAQC